MNKCIKWIPQLQRLCLRSCEGSRCTEHVTQTKLTAYVFPGEDTPTVIPPAMAAAS